MNSRTELPLLFAQKGYTRGAEVGVYRGEFATIIADNWSGDLYLIDAWRHVTEFPYAGVDHEQNYQHVSTILGVRPNVHLIRKLSLEAAQDFDDGYLDWVYLDADHAYASICADLRAWYEKIRSGGTLCGHDYFTDQGFGVEQAVNEFVAERGLTLEIDHDWPPNWRIVKP